MTPECRHESDVLDAVASGRWSDDLRAHVSSCRVCADLALVTQTFADEREAAWQHVQVPPSGRVWWRAELRARQEAARTAAAPIGIAHAVAGVAAVALLVLVAALSWPAV